MHSMNLLLEEPMRMASILEPSKTEHPFPFVLYSPLCYSDLMYLSSTLISTAPPQRPSPSTTSSLTHPFLAIM
jgi:hypothetical protein